MSNSIKIISFYISQHPKNQFTYQFNKEQRVEKPKKTNKQKTTLRIFAAIGIALVVLILFPRIIGWVLCAIGVIGMLVFSAGFNRRYVNDQRQAESLKIKVVILTVSILSLALGVFLNNNTKNFVTIGGLKELQYAYKYPIHAAINDFEENKITHGDFVRIINKHKKLINGLDGYRTPFQSLAGCGWRRWHYFRDEDSVENYAKIKEMASVLIAAGAKVNDVYCQLVV